MIQDKGEEITLRSQEPWAGSRECGKCSVHTLRLSLLSVWGDSESLCLWATRSDACVDHTSYQCRQLRNGPQGSTARTCRRKTCSFALCESGEATTKAGPRGLHSLSGEDDQRDPSTSSATRTQKPLLPFLFSCLHNEPLKKSIPITLQALQTPRSLLHLQAQHRARHTEAWSTLRKRPPLRSLLIAVCAPFLEGTAWHHSLKVAKPQKKTLLKVTCKPRGKLSSMSLQKIERSANILVFP